MPSPGLRAGIHHPRRASASPSWMLALAAGLGVAAIAFVTLVLWPRWPMPAASPDAPILPITIGGGVFNVRSAAIRVPLQRHAGSQERIDLVFLWPSLEPPDPAVRPAPTDQPNAWDRLFVTLAEATKPDPGERLKDIYPGYLAAAGAPGPDGLTATAFRDGTPYQGEDLFVASADPEVFAARCSRPVGTVMPGTCLLYRRLGGAEMTVRFPRPWLGDWRHLVAGVERILAGMRPQGA